MSFRLLLLLLQMALLRYLTTQEVAERYRTAPATIRYWRHIGYGTKGIRIGRRVLYDERALEAFDEAMRRAEPAA